MTLLHFDGFRSYANAADYVAAVSEKVLSQYTTYNDREWHTNYSRFGSPDRGMRCWHSGYPCDCRLVSALSPSTVVIGVVFKKVVVGNVASTSEPFIRMMDDTGGSTHINITLNSSYDFEVYRNITLLGTSSGKVVAIGTWHILEAKVFFDNSVGTVELKLDGVQILNLTGQDTLEGANAYARYFALRAFYHDLNTYFDCWYICDTAGAAPQNDFLGDVRCDVIRPNGVGNQSAFTPSIGVNWENVDDITPDGVTTNNSDAVVNDQDSYALPSLAPGGTIFGVKSGIVVAKGDAGAKGCKILTRSNITFYKGNEISPSTTYGRFSKVYQDNPDDAAAWAEADIAGMEVGVEVSS